MKSANPYVAYFVNQAKGKGHIQLGGSLPGFQGARIHKGFGLCTLFRGFYDTALPFAKVLGATTTTILDTRAKIMKDVAKGRNFRKSLVNRGKQGELKFFNKAKTQMVGCQNGKRKRVIKESNHSRSKQRRVSKEIKGMKGVFNISSKTTTAYPGIQRYFQLQLMN